LDHTEWPPTSQHVQHAHWMRVAADCPRHDTAMRTRHTCTHSLHAHWPQLTSLPRSPKGVCFQEVSKLCPWPPCTPHTHHTYNIPSYIPSRAISLRYHAVLRSRARMLSATARTGGRRSVPQHAVLHALVASRPSPLSNLSTFALLLSLTHLASVFAKLLRAPESNPRRSTCDESNASSKAVCSKG
jgi:hypothetical protein